MLGAAIDGLFSKNKIGSLKSALFLSWIFQNTLLKLFAFLLIFYISRKKKSTERIGLRLHIMQNNMVVGG